MEQSVYSQGLAFLIAGMLLTGANLIYLQVLIEMKTLEDKVPITLLDEANHLIRLGYPLRVLDTLTSPRQIGVGALPANRDGGQFGQLPDPQGLHQSNTRTGEVKSDIELFTAGGSHH
jgi:hypothetical protein